MRSKWQAAIIVEGYLDVVALAQSEVYGAFATQGTAISAHHLTSVFQLTTELVFCFDGDKAGQGAAWKALELVLPLLTSERQVRFAFLPKGEDPDSYIRQSGGPAFLALIQRSTPLSEYFFSHLCQKIPPDSLDNRARLVNLARPLIEQIPAGVFKEMMFEELAKYAQSTTQVVHGEKAPRELRDNPRRPYKQNNYYPPNKQAPAQPLASAAYITSALLIRHPIFLPLVKEEIARLQDLSVAGIELLRFLLQLLENNPALTKLEIHQQLQESGFTLKRLENCDSKLALIPEQGWEAELRGSIARLVAIGQQQLAEKLLQKSKISDLTPEEKLLLVETLQFRESN
jgi:DNA primase